MAGTPTQSEQSEQSMEEILQSIKRIIAEEGDDPAVEVGANVMGNAFEGLPGNTIEDVLELTEQVSDEEMASMAGGVEDTPIAVDALLDSLAGADMEREDAQASDVNTTVDDFEAIPVLDNVSQKAKNKELVSAEELEAFNAELAMQDGLSALAIDDAQLNVKNSSEDAGGGAEIEAIIAADAPEDSHTRIMVDAPSAAAMLPENEAKLPPVLEEGLASEQTLAAASAALSQLKSGSEAHYHTERIPFRSGMTVEDLVLEAMRPMLREWLNNNLPQMVETLVAKEIARISGK